MGLNDWDVIKTLWYWADVDLSDKYSVSGKYSITTKDAGNLMLLHKKYWGDIPEMVVTFWITIEHANEYTWFKCGPVIQYLWWVCGHHFRLFDLHICLNKGNQIESVCLYYKECNLPFVADPWTGRDCEYIRNWYITSATGNFKNIVGEKWNPGYWILFAFNTHGSNIKVYISEPIEKPNPKEIPQLHKIIDVEEVTWYGRMDGRKGLILGCNKPHFVFLDDYKIYDP